MKFNKKNDEKHNNHKKMVKKVVFQIMKNKITTMPFDYLFRNIIDRFPETNHKLLGLPGEFKKKENTTVFVNEKTSLEMDYLESVFPDGDLIKRESSINVEQETLEIRPEKCDRIFEYCLNKTIALKKPCYPFVATNYNYKADALLHYVEGIIFFIRLIIFDEKRVYEILNKLNEKDYSKEEFSIEDYVLFNYCMVFAKKPYAKDIMEKLARLFESIDNISIDLKTDLHSSLCLMIKYHFKDAKKIEELITLITYAMEEEELEDLPNQERLKLNLAKSEERYFRGEKERLEMLSELSQKDNVINQKDKKLAQKDNVINQKDNVINQKDKKLAEKDKKIAKLQKILLENNIII